MSREKENRRCCTRSAPSPSQSRLTPCQLPRKGSFSRSGGKQSKTSPFRGRWHRAAMTERVLSVPPALFLSGLALSVTFGDTSFPFLSRKRHPFPSLSPAVTFLPGRGESVPAGGSLSKREALAKPSTLCFYQEVYRHAKGSPFGRAVKADRH